MKHTMFEIVRAQAEDATALLDYLKIIGGETDNLSFAPSRHFSESTGRTSTLT